MEEWLLHHAECPCCRHNYLSLDGEDLFVQSNTSRSGVAAGAAGLQYPGGISVDPDENSAFLRGVHLFYLLSRLQSLADTRPNTTIRLEDVELANGRRGNLEIQRATDDSMDLGGR